MASRTIRLAVVTVLALAATLALAGGQDRPVPVRLQLKWYPQAQFAGYFVAKEKGYYAAEGLDVTFSASGSEQPERVVASGRADFGISWIASLLTARQAGLPVVHVAQVFQESGFALVSLRSSGISSLAQLRGKRLGVWPAGNEYPAVAALKKYGLSSSLDPGARNPDVQAVTYPFDTASVFPKRVDAVSAMTYNELNQILGMGYRLSDLRVFRLADHGINLLEDLIFTTEGVLRDRNFAGYGASGRDVAARLVRASLRGWDYAVRNQAEAVRIVLANCSDSCKGSGLQASALSHQTWQMREVARLYRAGPTLSGSAGLLDHAAYADSVRILREQGILKAAPDAGATDYGVWEAATGRKAPR